MSPKPQIVSVVGKSNSGKTTLIERIIPVLKARGYRIGTVKHTPHAIEVDRPGKDSYRHKAAGADAVMVAGGGRIALIKDMAEIGFDELAGYFAGMDLIITEGYKQTDGPKIEVCRAARSDTPICLDDPFLVALVTDIGGTAAKVPVFGLNEVEALADFIEDRFLQPPALGLAARS